MPFLNTTDRFEVFARPSVSSVCVFVKTFAAHHSRLLFFLSVFFQTFDVCIHHPSNNGNRKTLKKPQRGFTLFWLLRQRGTRTNDDDVAESQTNFYLFILFFKNSFHLHQVNIEHPIESHFKTGWKRRAYKNRWDRYWTHDLHVRESRNWRMLI